MVKIEGKWEWIANRLCELGHGYEAAIAREIHELLVEIYGEDCTNDWILDYDDIDWRYINSSGSVRLLILYSVATSAKYCIACMSHSISKTGGIRCDCCKFGEVVGICGRDYSVYRYFISRIRRIIFMVEG